MNIQAKIQDIIVNITQIDFDLIKDIDDLNLIPNWDSMQSLRLMTALENEFNIEIPLYQFIEIKSVLDLVLLCDQ